MNRSAVHVHDAEAPRTLDGNRPNCLRQVQKSRHYVWTGGPGIYR